MWHLVLLDAEGKEAQRFQLSEAEPITIGRGRENRIVLQSNAVSRNHAQLQLQNGRPLLQDQASANGTLLNRRPLDQPAALADGDEISIAEFRLRVVHYPSAGDSAAPAAGAEKPLARSATALLDQQMAGIRSFRGEHADSAGRKAAEFDQQWSQIMASLRELQQRLRKDPRIMYFTIDRESREATIKIADPKIRGGGLVLVLSRVQPEGQHPDQPRAWIRVLNERDAQFSNPQEALERFVQRIAGRLA